MYQAGNIGMSRQAIEGFLRDWFSDLFLPLCERPELIFRKNVVAERLANQLRPVATTVEACVTPSYDSTRASCYCVQEGKFRSINRPGGLSMTMSPLSATKFPRRNVFSTAPLTVRPS